jgi:hypothetical protein
VKKSKEISQFGPFFKTSSWIAFRLRLHQNDAAPCGTATLIFTAKILHFWDRVCSVRALPQQKINQLAEFLSYKNS